MDEKLRKKIIVEYKKGKGSTTIEKELGVSKPTILKILNSENLIRKKERCKKINIEKIDDKFVVNRSCPSCGEQIKVSSNNHSITCRNYYNTLKKNCKKCSLKLQVGEGNPFYGKKHSEKSKKIMSNTRKGKSTGNNNPMSNPIWRKKASDNLKKKWDSGELEKTRQKMSESLKKTRREGKIKSNITSKKEKEIFNLLKKKKLSPIQSFRIDTKICDIYIPKLNLIIEYFGDYWHCNPKKYDETYYNQKKLMTAKEIWNYDNKKIDLIKSFGYNLEVIWEGDLKNDNKLINKIIDKYVKSK